MLFFAFGQGLVLAEAPKREVKDYSVQEMIGYYANYYGANKNQLMVVAKCESNFKTNVYGDGGRAYSIYQFHKPTFESFAKLLGEDLDYYSYHDNIKLASFIFAKYPQYKSHWTCHTLHFKS